MKSNKSTEIIKSKQIAISPEDIKSAFNIQPDSQEDLNLGLMVLNQIASTYCVDNYNEELLANILASVGNLRPADHIEAMLVAQMLVTHNATMANFTRATRHCASSNLKTIDVGNAALSLGNKLARTYTMQIEALNRYRSKGQQKMTVEHVHINSGGQAIIGNVTKNDITTGGVEQRGSFKK